MAWTGNTFLVPTYKPYWLDHAGVLLAFSVGSYRIKKREYNYYTTEKIRSADVEDNCNVFWVEGSH